MSIFLSAVMIAASYFIGSVPMGLMLVWLATRRDVRQVGSGRTGGTNTLRAAGPWVALLTVLADLGKGFLSVWLSRVVIGTQGIESPLVESLAGLMAVIGHNYPIFIRFRGGAGTMTTGGGALALWPWNAPILIPLGVGVIALTEAIAVEVKGSGVTANVILPSIIDTPDNRASMPKGDPNKWVPPRRIAATMRFLCSDAAASINGARVEMYGAV